jgi:hypothetical protein
MAGNDHPGGAVSLQSSHRSQARLQTSMIGLEPVVRMDSGVMEGGREQLVEDAGIGPVPVGGDLGGLDPRAADRSFEGPTGRIGIPTW